MGTHCLDITLHFMECENMILEDMILEETSCFISDNLQGASKKTSFSENWMWQILLLIMRNPPSFSLTNTGDSFCSPWYPSSCGTPPQERIAEAD